MRISLKRGKACSYQEKLNASALCWPSPDFDNLRIHSCDKHIIVINEKMSVD